MEGLPRMPMLSVELKFCPVSTDFGDKLKAYIAKAYEDSPDAYSKEIAELNALRENAIKAPADFTGCGTLKKYFAQLHLLRSRFPMEENDDAAVGFTWYEKFSDMPSPVTYEDVRYELACILHNIGAVHSYLATLDTRLTLDGMKASCTHFQCASWAFQCLRDDSPFRLSASTYSPDFDRHIMDWYVVLMLAQAQECILEKSLVDNRKSHIIAKVAYQVAEYYAQCARVLDEQSVADAVGSSKCKSWRKFIEMKHHFYRSVAYYQLGNQSDEQQKMGERLAYYQLAAAALKEAVKLGQKESETVRQSLQFAEDVIVGRFNVAKKENDFIYHEKIPSVDALPELKGASLVKGIPFDPLDTNVSGADIFQRLVPLDVHRASSMYSEEKAKLLRRVGDDVDVKNEALREFMMSLKIDGLITSGSDSGQQQPLPDALIERCAAFNARPSAVPDLLSQMVKLPEFYQHVEQALTEVERKMNDDEKEAKNFLKEIYGDEGSKLSDEDRKTILRLTEFREEINRYRQANQHATKSNTELHKALASHSDNLQMLTLSLNDLKKQLPAPMAELTDSQETQELKRLLGKVEEMTKQRETLMEQLRKQAMEDDVTKVLLADKDHDPEEIFSKELKKYEKQIAIIDQNLAAQENIVKALTEANAKYGGIRKQITAITKQRDAKIMSLIAAYDVYTDLERKSKEGVEFYEKLKRSLQEFDAKYSKWSESDLSAFFNRCRSEIDKRTAVAKARAQAYAATASTPQPSETSGPKLKDYMAYYRAKKAAPNAAASMPFPGSNPALASAEMPVSNFPISHAVNGQQTWSASNGVANMVQHMPPAPATGAYSSVAANAVPTPGYSQAYYAHSTISAVPSSGYSTTSASTVAQYQQPQQSPYVQPGTNYAPAGQQQPQMLPGQLPQQNHYTTSQQVAGYGNAHAQMPYGGQPSPQHVPSTLHQQHQAGGQANMMNAPQTFPAQSQQHPPQQFQQPHTHVPVGQDQQLHGNYVQPFQTLQHAQVPQSHGQQPHMHQQHMHQPSGQQQIQPPAISQQQPYHQPPHHQQQQPYQGQMSLQHQQPQMSYGYAQNAVQQPSAQYGNAAAYQQQAYQNYQPGMVQNAYGQQPPVNAVPGASAGLLDAPLGTNLPPPIVPTAAGHLHTDLANLNLSVNATAP